MHVELLTDSYLVEDLRAFLTANGLLVADGGPGAVEVLAPDAPTTAEAAAAVTASAQRWAALRGVAIAVRPPADRVAAPSAAHPTGRAGRPAVSIGVPVYNGARYLPETLESLLGQTYADFELILCDNGSDDGTAEICAAYAARDDRVRYLPSDVNRGAAWNYNRALDAAGGRYFKWAAHDDLCAPTYLERCVEVLDRAPDSVVLAYPKTVLIDGNGRFLGPYEDGLDLRQPEPHRRLRTLIRNLVLSNAVFGLVRSDALRRTRGHGSFISADYVLLAELALLGQFWEVPEPLFLRRDHPQTSRRANRTSAELAEWFVAGAGRTPSRESVPLFREYLVALRRAPDLGPLSRLRAYGTILPWLRRFRRSLLSELIGPSLPPPAPAAGAPDRIARGDSIERLVVHDVVRAAVWSIAPDYTPHVRVHVDPRLTLDADRAALDRVLVNLISNAVRYGRGPITVRADVASEFVLTVEDRGRGISHEFLPHLFEPFARSSHSARESPGLGLGLAVAQMTARECGGALTYEGGNPGARFRLTLPHGDDDAPGRRTPSDSRSAVGPVALRAQCVFGGS